MEYREYRLLFEADKNRAEQLLYNEYINYVYAIVFSRLRSCATREDISECVIDVFIDIYTFYEKGNVTSEDMKGFIGTVAYRKAAAYFKKLCRNRSVPLDELADTLPSGEDIQQNAEQKDLHGILLDMIDSLGEPDSTIIVQKYFYGRNSREIARIVPLSPVMIRVRSGRALKKLRKLLSDKNISL